MIAFYINGSVLSAVPNKIFPLEDRAKALT
jgi:hypothetical protein